jgi:hypothetical protein
MRFVCRIPIVRKDNLNMRLIAEKLASLKFERFRIINDELLLCLEVPNTENVIKITDSLKVILADVFGGLEFNEAVINEVKPLTLEKQVGDKFSVNQYITL